VTLAAQGRRILVADPGQSTGDLARDITGVLTTMCARLYARRGIRGGRWGAVRVARNAGVGAVRG
jgi:putative resolvase